jgi:Zn-dependent peptidase ImmA (M78 family)
LFALVHELKHHWVDQELIESGELQCGDYNQNELEEKGAEVFAAEFIYPEEEFAADISRSGISDWDVDAIVRFKREFCRAKVSYTYIRKRLEWLSMIGLGEFADVRFQAREEELHGIPFYKQPGYQMRRRMKVRAR